MPTKYLDEEGLSHVVRRAKETFAEKKELWNWQKTEKAVAVAFEPVPDSVLEPVVEFKFKETLPAEGEKGPDNPSTIEGVSSATIWHTGKNLLCADNVVCIPDRGVTATVNGDGSVSIVGITIGNGILQFLPGGTSTANNIKNTVFVPGHTYTVSLECDDPNVYGYAHYSSDGGVNWLGLCNYFLGGQSRTFTIPENATGIQIWTQATDGTVLDTTVKMQCELGDTATSFEKGVVTSSTIDFGSTYYGGIVDIASGSMTVTHLGFAFDGTEEWRTIGNVGAESDTFRHDLINSSFPELRRHVGWPTCSHFSTETNTGSLRAYLSGVFQETTWFFVVVDTNAVYSTNEAWKAFLATQYANGTPVTIAYQLETPFDIQLSPTQIKSLASDKYVPQLNTVYTDQKSIQVGYQKFADIDGAVHTTGDETIDGIKTFKNSSTAANGVTYTSLYIRNSEINRGIAPEHSSYTNLIFLDKDGEAENTKNGRLGMVETISPQEDSNERTRLICYKYSDELTDAQKHVSLDVGYDLNGNPYASAPATSDERTEASDIATRGWVDSKIKSNVWNWLKTEKTKIASFEPVADSGIQPIVYFKFTETPPMEGDKSASNPSTIAGVEGTSVVCCGKNLFNYDCSSADVADGITVESSGITVFNNKGTYSFSGSNTSGETKYFHLVNRQNNELLLPPGTYTLTSNFKNIGNLDIRVQLIAYQNGVSILDTHSSTSSRTFEIPDGEPASILLYFRIADGVVIPENVTAAPQIEVGDQSTDFEPYAGSTYQYSFGSTFYGGYVNLATGVMTVTHDTVELNENTYLSGMIFEELDEVYNVGFYPNPVRKMTLESANEAACTNFDIAVGSGAKHYQCVYLANNAMGIRLQLLKSELNLGDSADPADVRTAVHAWLGEHPGFLVYPVAEPYKVQLAPMQIKSLQSNDIYSPVRNYLYSNLNEVEVGYQRVANDSSIVHTIGNETIDGIKTIANTRPAARAGETVTSIYFRNPEVTRGVLHPTGRSWTQMLFLDANGEPETNQAGRLGMFELVSPSSATPNSSESMAFVCYKFTDNPNEYNVSSALKVGFDVNEIPYATAPSTSTDRDSGTDIVTRDWLPKDIRIPQKSDLWNWQKTERAGAVTFKPTSNSPIEPIISFKFNETMPVEGEKGPENPSTITGINGIHLGRCGKNILKPLPAGTTTKQGVTISTNGDGIYTLNGTSTGQIFHHIERFCANWFKEGVSYTASTSMSQANDAFQIWVGNSAYGGGYLGKRATKVPSKTLDSNVAIYIPSGATLNNVICNPQIEYGTQATSFETGEGESYSVSLGNTYYGGEINLATGVMTVTWYGIVYTGTETWDGPDNHSANGVECYSFALTIPSELKALSRADGQDETNTFCSHFNYVPDTSITTNHFYIPGSGAYPAYFTTFCKTLDNWKTWVQEQYANGHPLTLTYKLNTPFTVELTIEQILSLVNFDKYSPRINTIYTDVSSVQVGYQRYVNEDNFVDKESRIPDEEIDEAFAE